MKELFVLIIGFSAATKVWLAAWDINVFRKQPDRTHVTRFWRSLGRIGVALTLSVLAIAVAQSPGPVPLTVNGIFYLVGSVLLLVGTLGELNTYNWEDDRV